MGKKVQGLLGPFPLLLSRDSYRADFPWLSPNPNGMPAYVVISMLGMEDQNPKKIMFWSQVLPINETSTSQGRR